MPLPARRYQEFKAALEGLDPKRQSVSPLPIIYQWQQPMGGPGTKCACLHSLPAKALACFAFLAGAVRAFGDWDCAQRLPTTGYAVSSGSVGVWLRPARACRFDASKMRAGVRKFTSYQDVPHLDKAFILQNLRHMEALQILDPA